MRRAATFCAVSRRASAVSRELAAPLRMSFAGASKHIKALEHAGLIRREVRGRTHVCHLEARRMEAALEWIRFYERFWTHHLDLLERELNKPDPGASKGDVDERLRHDHRPARSAWNACCRAPSSASGRI